MDSLPPLVRRRLIPRIRNARPVEIGADYYSVAAARWDGGTYEPGKNILEDEWQNAIGRFPNFSDKQIYRDLLQSYLRGELSRERVFQIAVATVSNSRVQKDGYSPKRASNLQVNELFGIFIQLVLSNPEPKKRSGRPTLPSWIKKTARLFVEMSDAPKSSEAFEEGTSAWHLASKTLQRLGHDFEPGALREMLKRRKIRDIKNVCQKSQL